MGGYVTSTRTMPGILPSNYTWRSTGGGSFGTWNLANSYFPARFPWPTQVTTSWRTGRGAPEQEEDLSRELDNEPQTLAGEASFLKSFQDKEAQSSSLLFDNGHTFSTTKYSGWLTHAAHKVAGWDSLYVGPILPVDTVSGGTRWIDPGAADSAFVKRSGVAAIAATQPTNPASTFGVGLLSTTIEGLPRIPGQIFHIGEDFMRNLAHGHLSVNFDWLPFISDLRSSIHAMLNASRILRQYQRDSGRMVRRSFHFPEEHSFTKMGESFTININAPSGGSSTAWSNMVFGTGGVSKTSRYVETIRRTYFKGAYTYFLPPIKDRLDWLQEYEQKANHLLGLELTPTLLWQLAPWSWLIDWKLNVGQNLKTFSNFHTDGLVLRYGYLMVHTITNNIISVNALKTSTSTNVWQSIDPTVVYSSERKERIRSTPYGFGVDPASFTTKQWSILGALGMTRSPSKLRTDS